MGGGLLNIKSYGNQNIILNGNPSKSFFDIKYHQYSNFGIQKFRIDYSGLRTLRLNEESLFQFKIPRHGDMLMNAHVAITLPTIWSPIYPPQDIDGKWVGYDFKWIDNIGCEMIKDITIMSGGHVLQKIPGSYIKNMARRDYPDKKLQLFNKLTGHVPELNDPGNAEGRVNAYPNAYYTDHVNGAHPSIDSQTLYVPIPAWFSSSSKTAFPLLSLQSAELYINVTIRPIVELYRIRDVTDTDNLYPYVKPDTINPNMQMYRFLHTPPSKRLYTEDYTNQNMIWNADVHLIANYAFLTACERNMMVNRPYSILYKDIHTHRINNVYGNKRKVEVETAGLVSSWMFHFTRSDVSARNEWSNYTNWPYRWKPYNVEISPIEDGYKYSGYGTNINAEFESFYKDGFGPGLNPDHTASNIMITGPYRPENSKSIITSFGLMFDGVYRETPMPIDIYSKAEPFHVSTGTSDDTYQYNFCINTNSDTHQPSGAINLASFKKIEFEVNTIAPPLKDSAQVMSICDSSGNVIGINKNVVDIYKYTYDLTIYEERYNMLTVSNGLCKLMYAR